MPISTTDLLKYLLFVRIAYQEKSDIYDLGVILLEIIMGKHINTNDEVAIFRHQVRLNSIPIITHPLGCSL